MIHFDEPLTNHNLDELGYKEYAKDIANVLENIHESGYVIGIEGNCGSGKTSFRRSVKPLFRCRAVP